MAKTPLLASSFAGAALATLTGCVADAPTQSAAIRPRPTIHVQASMAIMDDYDYYPGYEVYYSRNRREYVYLEGRTWIRRPAPQGVTVALLTASPSVRVDFRDSPEQHHSRVVKAYPRNWAPPGRGNDMPNRSNQPPVPVRTTVVITDDYDYYPGYETYYSRNRREYVYLEGSAWVRRPAPQGVAVNILVASPSVRMAFQDTPERHHGEIVRTYPRNWVPPGKRDDKHPPNKGRDDKDDDDKDNRKGKNNDR